MYIYMKYILYCIFIYIYSEASELIPKYQSLLFSSLI